VCAVLAYLAALLVSLHADTIYAQYFNFNEARVENSSARFSRRTASLSGADGALHADRSAEQASPETIAHNRLLIAALDRMSLEIAGT